MRGKAITPAIRFAGFTDAWERRKFSELFLERRDKTEKEDEDTLLSCAITGMFLNTELFGHFRGTSNIGYLRVKWGDLILSAQNLHLGNANVNLRFEHGIISPAYKVFDLINMDPFFTQAWVKRENTKDFFLAATTEGASQCRKNIEWGFLRESKVCIPKIEEQQVIGCFFNHLDHLITLHQRKYSRLYNIKKSMLERMFPKEGASVPEIRFAGFTDAWEQCKLSELSERTYGGGTPATSKEVFWDGEIPWIQSSDIPDGKLFGVEPKKYISQDGLNNSAAQLVPKDSIAIITRVGVGKLALMPFSYTTSQDFLSLSRLNTEPFFTIYACYKKLQSELNAVQGTSIKGITKDELLAKVIKVPTYAEQQQIGTFFRHLDHLITLHQRKLERLQNIKKSCLEKMFV